MIRAISRLAPRRSFATLPSLHKLSDSEREIQTAVAKFAKEVVGPKVSEMDEKELLDRSVLQGLFDQVCILCEVLQHLIVS
jgi:hypothetical protein